MTHILITGGTGFIGIPLVKKLHDLGHDLTLLVRETSDVSPFKDLQNIKYSIGDVRDIESIRNATKDIDVIYHLAAYTGIWAKDSSIYYDINVNGTLNMAKVAMEKDLNLYYVSSFTALGPTPPEPVDETYENDKLYMHYEKSKFQARKEIKNLIQKGLKTVIFYPGIVYGPGDFNIFGQMLFDIMRGKFMGCPGKGDSIACFTYVKDLVNAMVKALNKEDILGEDFIIGGENVKFIDYLNMIAEISETKKPRKVPMSLAKIYALFCELKSKITKKMPYITRSTLNGMKYHRAYSSQKAIDLLGYEITPLRKGLEETIAWYQNFLQEKEENLKK